MNERVFNLGPDDLGDFENLGDNDFLVYWYEQEDYDGWGEAILVKDGRLYEFDLSHCSCYGPCEDWVSWEGNKVSPDPRSGRPLESIDWADVHDLQTERQEVINQVRELLGV